MKRKCKLITVLGFSLSLVLTLVGCGGTGDSAKVNESKERTWKISHVRPEGTSTDIDIKSFAEDVKTNSEGKITTEIYPASSLGNYTVVQERVALGDVTMQLAPAGTSVTKAMAIASTPYIVSTWDDVRKVYARDSVLITEMEKMFDKENIKLLGTYPKYFGGIALAKEAKEPTNPNVSKGIKIRVPAMEAYQKTAEALGFIATPIAYSEAFTAMQTGIVDGAIGSGAEGYYSSFKDLTKYYLPVNDHFEMWFLYMSKDTWNDLSDAEKKVVGDAALKMEKERFDSAEAEEQEFIDKLKAGGTVIVEYSDTQLDVMAKKVKSEVWPVIKDEIGTELFDTITK
jgi:TRAP-type C4-dicarboxylate transport system substrate-binding protein